MILLVPNLGNKVKKELRPVRIRASILTIIHYIGVLRKGAVG